MQNSEDPLVEHKSDAVPWTIQQTFLGFILTFIPWVVFVPALSRLGQGKATPKTPLSFHADLGNAIFVFIFSCIIQGAVLIAPLYIANGCYHSITPHFRVALHAVAVSKP